MSNTAPDLIKSTPEIVKPTRPKQITNFEDTFSEEVWRATYKDYTDDDVNDTFWRVAVAIASVEKTPVLQDEWAIKFYDMMTDFKVVPGGRILANAGTGYKGTTLINCFVSPDVTYDIDSMQGILKNLENQSLTLKSEGGWGHNFSAIRPRGAFIHGIGVETPGAVKFMELFDKSSEIITAGSGIKSKNIKAKGKIRKGAMMGVLDVWHKDIIEFITAKQTPGRLSKFNVSVNCTNEFMEKVLEVHNLKVKQAAQLSEKIQFGTFSGEEITQETIDSITWNLVFPDTEDKHYKKEWKGDIQEWKAKGYPVFIHQTVKVEWLWNLITQSTYNRNEPGILFLDRANKYNQFNYGEKIRSTNPCGEQMLAPAGVCCLGTLNLTQFVNADRTGFDLRKVRKYAQYLVRFLDNVNEYSDAPLSEYIDAMRNKRRIGCGIMGWGSALLMMKIRFGSSEADKIRTELLKAFTHAGVEASIDLAEEKGMFSLCRPDKHAESPYWESIGLSKTLRDRISKSGIRNSSMFSCQPNGNSGILAQIITGGIEPVFMPEYTRTVIVGVTPDHIKDVTPNWAEGQWYETTMFKIANEGDDEILRGADQFGIVYKIDRNRGLTKEVLCQDYGVRYLTERGEWDSKADWAVTTTELTVEEHVSDLQGFAKMIDSAVSKTVNLPNNYPFEDFQNIYLNAYKTNFIKGLTTYRAGSMTSVLSAVEQKFDETEEVILTDIKLPDTSRAEVKVLRDHESGGSRKWYCTISLNENNAPIALFVQTNTNEKSVLSNDAVDRMLLMGRAKGIPDQYIDSTIAKCHGDSNSVKIARAISLLLRHGVRIKNIVAELDKIENVPFSSFLFQIKKLLAGYVKDGETVDGEVCANCGGNLVYESGCSRCVQCAASKCS